MQKLSKLTIGIHSSKFIDRDIQDFVVGETRKFVLEFKNQELAPASTNEKSVEFDRGNGHNVCAEVVYADSTFWVIDFGFLAFCISKPPDYATKGAYVKGKIGIDPCFYEKHWNNQSEISKITYNWKIESIQLENKPWEESVNIHGGLTSSIVWEDIGWIDTTQTKARIPGNTDESYELTLQKIT
jgi:hypothetical protein